MSVSDFPVLVVDDEKNIRRTLRLVLEGEGIEVLEAADVREATLLLGNARIDAMLLDVKLNEENGVDLLDRIKRGEVGSDREVPVVMISGHATLEDAVRATKAGAFDFLAKPLDRERVIVTVRNALERRALVRQVESLRGRVEMIGRSAVMQDLLRQISKVAPTRGRVLVTGESGTGKELVARAIHQQSPLAGGPFVKVNCAAIPRELIESELFGHERGAFTGAVGRKRGLFEVADGGTIFLDEIGDMDLSAQAKVLRVLQTGELVRVGGERTVRVDCRVIAATNKELEVEVAAGRFREDLWFRLNVVPLRVAPLRERLDDIPLLAEAFVQQCCEENGFRRKRLDAEVVQRLMQHSWPGNVRELRNVIERLVILSDDEIAARDLPPYLLAPRRVDSGPIAVPTPILAVSPTSPVAVPLSPGTPRPGAGGAGTPAGDGDLHLGRFAQLTLREFRDESEREFLRLKLREHEWNISRTAVALGIERTNLHKRLRALGIEREGSGPREG